MFFGSRLGPKVRKVSKYFFVLKVEIKTKLHSNKLLSFRLKWAFSAFKKRKKELKAFTSTEMM